MNAMITVFGFTFNVFAAAILAMVALLVIAIFRAIRDPEGNFDWQDLFTGVDQATGKTKASITKIMQIVGGATGTFIVIKLTFQNSITFDIFACYLAYVASIDSFSKFMVAKYGVQGSRDQDRYSDRYYYQDGSQGRYNQNQYPPPDYSQGRPSSSAKADDPNDYPPHT
jgi:hypothetical protein